MAAKRFLYLNAQGVNQESADDDSLVLGALAMTGAIEFNSVNIISGLAPAESAGEMLSMDQFGALLEGLSMSGDIVFETGNKITGLYTGLDPADAATKSYVDNLLTAGVTWREILLHPNQLSDTQGILSAITVGITGQPNPGDTITLSNGVTTRTYGAGTGGNVQYVIGTDFETTLRNLAAAILGDASGTWNAYYTTTFNGIVCIIERLYAEFRSKMYGTWTGHQSQCLIVDFTDELDYNKRSNSTLPSSAPTNGNFGFAHAHGDLNPGEMHIVAENDCLYTWDNDTEVWLCIAGSASVPDAGAAASGGGTKGKVGVDSDLGLYVQDGILGIDRSAASGLQFASGKLSIKPHGTTPGIELTADGLRTKQGGSNGIIASATGLEVEIDGSDTLSVSSAGLKVVGVPTLFKIDGTPTGSGVTKSHLDELTDGVSETALHFHAGVGSAERTEVELLAGSGGVTLADPVYVVATNDTVGKAMAVSTLDAKGVVVGIAHATKSSGNLVHIVMEGVAKDVLAEADPGTIYYLDVSGGIVDVPPATAGSRIVSVGVAINADDLLVAIRDFGKLAA